MPPSNIVGKYNAHKSIGFNAARYLDNRFMIEFYPSDQIESRDAQRILPYEPLIRGEVAS